MMRYITLLLAVGCESADVAAPNVDAGTALTTEAIPRAAVMAFNRASCPDGWSVLTAATGRVIVGGTAGTKVGTALIDGGARRITEVPLHGHVVRINGGNSHQVAAVRGSSLAYEPQAHDQQLNAEIGTTSYADPAGAYGILTGRTGNPAGVDVTMPYLQLLVCQKD